MAQCVIYSGLIRRKNLEKIWKNMNLCQTLPVDAHIIIGMLHTVCIAYGGRIAYAIGSGSLDENFSNCS